MVMTAPHAYERSTLATTRVRIEPGSGDHAKSRTPVPANERRRLVVLIRTLPLLVLATVIAADAQQLPGATRVLLAALPDAPQPQSGAQGISSSAQSSEPGTISGVVFDLSEARVIGARVTLSTASGVQVRTVMSQDDGAFIFAAVPPGSYTVAISADGLEPFTFDPFVLMAGQVYNLPKKLLDIASANSSIEVRPTDVVAAEQIKQEEKQRIFGFAPNFYVSYVPNAAPMTTKQKYSLAAHDTLDWTTYIGVGVGAGIEQADNNFSGYGQGAAGYAKRWGALFADGRSSDFLSHAVYASMFHQDPRYFYQGTGTTKSRLYHALSSAFVARSDSGTTMPNYSYLLGAMTSGALSNAYYPHANRGVGLVFTTAGIGIGGRALQSVIQEFLSKKFTTNVPAAVKP
jgi:hypothetical protein